MSSPVRNSRDRRRAVREPEVNPPIRQQYTGLHAKLDVHASFISDLHIANLYQILFLKQSPSTFMLCATDIKYRTSTVKSCDAAVLSPSIYLQIDLHDLFPALVLLIFLADSAARLSTTSLLYKLGGRRTQEDIC